MIRRLAIILIHCASIGLLASCASTGETPRPPRQITSCPPGEVLICESREPPSTVSDEEIPAYERCYCRSPL